MAEQDSTSVPYHRPDDSRLDFWLLVSFRCWRCDTSRVRFVHFWVNDGLHLPQTSPARMSSALGGGLSALDGGPYDTFNPVLPESYLGEGPFP